MIHIFWWDVTLIFIWCLRWFLGLSEYRYFIKIFVICFLLLCYIFWLFWWIIFLLLMDFVLNCLDWFFHCRQSFLSFRWVKLKSIKTERILRRNLLYSLCFLIPNKVRCRLFNPTIFIVHHFQYTSLLMSFFTLFNTTRGLSHLIRKRILRIKLYFIRLSIYFFHLFRLLNIRLIRWCLLFKDCRLSESWRFLDLLNLILGWFCLLKKLWLICLISRKGRFFSDDLFFVLIILFVNVKYLHGLPHRVVGIVHRKILS